MTNKNMQSINSIIDEYSQPYQKELKLLSRIEQAQPSERKPKKNDLQDN
jgi:hypothetical protein